MKNTPTDLNNYLFESLERLLDDDLSEEEMQKEITRSKSICEIAGRIIDNADLTLKALKFLNDNGIEINPTDIPKMLGVKE